MKDGSLHWRARNLSGQLFGALTALHPAASDGRKVRWAFRCQCGSITVKVGADVVKEVKRGGTPNCGCLTKSLHAAKATHGMSRHPAYAVWASMVARCHRATHPAYKNYGARGIFVSPEWRKFAQFWADMGPTYRPGLTLDRRDNSRGYEKANCRWVGWGTQAKNRRASLPVDIPALSRVMGIPRSTLYYRWNHGLSLTSSTAAPASDS